MKMKTGTVVRLLFNCLGNEAGTIGVCYEEYNIGNAGAGSIIFENGSYDGFSPDEQTQMLVKIGHDYEVANYQFNNVMQLSQDFKNGKFDTVFKPKQKQ